ncbi:MAG: MmcQ/YjbR family DNA-binding protein [Candidatus Didemnitutus sp.]|nr:MmcQ/YjbR family DNA-binding protein [Candidatus Didemnitutus sp.]
MTAADFRRLVLALPGASEGAHCGHADFRLGGRVIASLESPDVGWAMVKLTPVQQAAVLRASAS